MSDLDLQKFSMNTKILRKEILPDKKYFIPD